MKFLICDFRFSILVAHRPVRTRAIQNPRSKIQNSAFTLVELLVMLGIVVVLIAIFIPYISNLRESDARVRCSDNLRLIRNALSGYAADHRDAYPRVRFNVTNPNSYTAYTGPDEANPFAPDSAVEPNDVTASLWLLLRERRVESVKFVCPSTWDRRDTYLDASGKKVRGPEHLSYSYASPFSSALEYELNANKLRSAFAVMADMSPGAPAATVSHDSPPLERARGNSPNHGGAGQNVLFGDGHVEWKDTPFCGIEDDNIYTALLDRPLEIGEHPPANAPGYVGRDIGPAWVSDSYLVPTVED
jgi:prepilin-type processing-associated H-X9-DG protein